MKKSSCDFSMLRKIYFYDIGKEKMNKEYIQGKAGNALIDLTKGVRKDFGDTIKKIKSLDDNILENERIAIAHIEKKGKEEMPRIKKRREIFLLLWKKF